MPDLLVIRACAVGDFVLNLPALHALSSQRYPDWNLTLVGYPAVLEIARDFMPVAAAYPIEKEPWRRLFYEPVQGLPFDAAVVWMKDPVVAENLRRSGVPEVHHRAPFPQSNHAGRHLLDSMMLQAPLLPDLWTPRSPRVLLHPGSGSPAKCWPKFAELASRVESAAFLIGPLERSFATGMYPRFENLSLAEAGALISESRALIGNDSGISHLAAYRGCPTIALFGPTNPATWGPVGRRVRILAKPSLANIEVEEIVELLAGLSV